jgi:hypothetical protein
MRTANKISLPELKLKKHNMQKLKKMAKMPLFARNMK